MGLLYTQELADRAQAWVSQPLNEKRSADGLLELATIWAAINRQPLPECLRQCQYSERSRSVAAYLLEFSRLPISPDAMSETTQSKYQIAPAFAGQQFVHEDLSAPVTAENLTDDLAEFFIKKGRKDAFILKGSAEAAPKSDGKPADAATEAADALKAEQDAHQATKSSLQAEKQGYERVLSDYNKANASRLSTENALKSEKEAHKATKKDLSEVQKQLAEAQKQLALHTDKAPGATSTAETPLITPGDATA